MNLNRLIHWIAQEVESVEDIIYIIAELSKVQAPEWKDYIEELKKKTRRREYAKVNKQNKRAKKEKLPATLTVDEWLETLRYFQRKCAYCQEEFSYQHLEHFFPISDEKYKVGTTAYNCVPACKKCNLSKGKKNMDYWCDKKQLILFEESEDSFKKNILRVYKYLESRHPKKDLDNIMVRCYKCDSLVKKKNLNRHLKRIHKEKL